MKTLTLNQKVIAVMMVIVAFSISICNAQDSELTMVPAYSTGYLYHTNAGDIFTWNGGSRSGYCDGTGTIQFYDRNNNRTDKYVGDVSYGKNNGYGTQYYANGYVYYQGYWDNDSKNGSGTTYYDDGSIQFKGEFVNGKLKNLEDFKELSFYAANTIMNKVFDGGINLKTQIIELVDNGTTDNELKVRVTFNGNIVTSNYYDFTIVINKKAPYIHFEQANDLAQAYIIYVGAQKAYELYQSLQQNQNQ